MRLTVRTNLAARALMACAANPDRVLRTQDIAERCNASVNHMFQVVNALQEHGFIETIRGRSGGVRLARPPERISVGAMFRDLEGSVPFTDCFEGGAGTCPLHGSCRLAAYLRRAVEAFYHELDMVTLADLVKGNCGLEALLDMDPRGRGQCAGMAPA
ncbi:MAG: Rrf2 family transcriptional regulator [Rubellimicrobium sp.]|nr:Rrf2 family transcriptional regulator [Rubellimicrobium sp.]